MLRTAKPAQPRRYLADPLASKVAVVSSGELTGEFLLNVLRLPQGASFDELESRTGCGRAALEPRWQRWADLGLLACDRVATTPIGYEHLDTLLQDFIC